jgi:hypothetical protein
MTELSIEEQKYNLRRIDQEITGFFVKEKLLLHERVSFLENHINDLRIGIQSPDKDFSKEQLIAILERTKESLKREIDNVIEYFAESLLNDDRQKAAGIDFFKNKLKEVERIISSGANTLLVFRTRLHLAESGKGQNGYGSFWVNDNFRDAMNDGFMRAYIVFTTRNKNVLYEPPYLRKHEDGRFEIPIIYLAAMAYRYLTKLKTIAEAERVKPIVKALPPQPIVESPFSVLEWATIFYYADETKLLTESRLIKTRLEQFMCKHQINTTFDHFKTKYYEAKKRINEKNDYPINKLELIIPFLKENYKQTVTKVENDIIFLEENKPEY